MPPQVLECAILAFRQLLADVSQQSFLYSVKLLNLGATARYLLTSFETGLASGNLVSDLNFLGFLFAFFLRFGAQLRNFKQSPFTVVVQRLQLASSLPVGLLFYRDSETRCES